MRTAILSLTICLASSFLPAQSVDVPLANWTVPTYHASSVTGGLTTMADVTPGVGFVGIQPCRVADTRGNGAIKDSIYMEVIGKTGAGKTGSTSAQTIRKAVPYLIE